MFGKICFLFLTIAVLGGCAEPKYVTSNPVNDRPAPLEFKADCQIQFSSSKLCLSWYWEKKPVSTEDGQLIFKVFRLNQLDQTAVEQDLAALPKVVLWMPSMGHGSVPTQVVQLDTGTYRASNVVFIMPGEWEIKFQVKEGNAVLDEVVVAFTQ